MHVTELPELFAGKRSGMKWPPPSEQARWSKAREMRRRFEADARVMFSHRPELHVPEDAVRTAARAASFTVAPILRDMCRLSAQLLLSEPPEITLAGRQQQLDALMKFNGLHSLLFHAAQRVASEGEGALRVIVDDMTSDQFPVITFEPADAVIWVMRHGRFVQSGIVVMEVEHDSNTVYRLLEGHTPGKVLRRLFKGSLSRLGDPVPLSAGPPAFRDLQPSVEIGVPVPTLIRWQHRPGAEPIGAGLESLMDAYDEAETVGRRKMRASGPKVFVARKLVDKNGFADLEGAIILGGDTREPTDDAAKLLTHVQSSIEADDHVAYCRHLRATILTLAGFSLASYGLDEVGGQADSGVALRLREHRSLLTRRQVEDEAVEAISQCLGVAMAMMVGGAPERLRPEVVLGTGIPEDETVRAANPADVRELESA